MVKTKWDVGRVLNAAVLALLLLSASYFGDKMSPLSDTTNLAPAMAGTDVMSHVKFMMLPTGITCAVCAVVFLILGFTGAGGTADMAQAHALGDAIHGLFNINPILLLPPVIVIVSIALKVPALPGIALGIFSGIILGMIFQGDSASLWKMMAVGYDGFTLDGTTGIDAVDNLLQRGGITSMLSSISLTIIAMMFGGIMEGTGMIGLVVEQLESAGTVTSALIPWNTCGAYITSTLGLKAWSATANGGAYGPWAIFNWLMPVMNIALAYLGWTVADKMGVRLAKKKKAA